MAALIYEPQSIKDPQNHPRRLYFSCCREDFAHFAKIAADIWEIEKDCIIAHIDFAQEQEIADHFPEIDDSQVLVIPITRQLLTTQNHAWSEFLHAAENKMAILPVLIDGDVEALFNERSGDRQFLVPTDPDYAEKLKRFLQSVLVKDDLAMRVQAAFPLKVFLSYCREDRNFVAELMRLIHAKDEYRQIAIWYDKYLSIGINFEQTIFEQIDSSEVFGMTLTPNLVGRPNYVQEKEYPYARDHKKRIILFEILPTDKAHLGAFEGVDQFAVLDANGEKAFYQSLAAQLKGLVTQTHSAQPGETDYLVGMAYMNGLQVEFDRSYAAGRLEKAGNLGSLEAVYQLVTMYRNGIGVARDAKKAIKWQKKATEKTALLYRRAFDEAVPMVKQIKAGPSFVKKLTEQEVYDVLNKLHNAAGEYYRAEHELARLLAEECRIAEADKRYNKMHQIAREVDKLMPEMEFGKYYGVVGNIEQAMMHMSRGENAASIKKCWETAMELYQREPDSYLVSHNAANSGYLYGYQIANHEPNEAIRIWAKSLTVTKTYLQANPAETSITELQIKIYRGIGQVFLQNGFYAEARSCLNQAVSVLEACMVAKSKDFPYALILLATLQRLIGVAYAQEGERSLAEERYQIAMSKLDAAEETARTKAVPADYLLGISKERGELENVIAKLET